MAGRLQNGEFREKLSPYLREKIEEVEALYGQDSKEYQALAKQYFKSDKEAVSSEEHNRRHYEADVHVQLSDTITTLHGMERLYKRAMVVEPTMACSCHCRYCLRGNYDTFNLTKEELLAIAHYCGAYGAETGLEEILITGGDPLLVPELVDFFVDVIRKEAPNIRIIRIATRLLTHDPTLINDKVLKILDKADQNLRFEIATQINHAVEFFPETVEAVQKLQKHGARVYSQNVLLKGVNDDFQTLVDLYHQMHYYDIESHYLFHCIPLKGMHHFRTSVMRGVELARQLTSSGYISGRAKPMYSLMTDVGKVTLYEGTILGREGDYLQLRTGYKYEDRMKWNPSWQLPDTGFITEDGYIGIKYLDGSDD